MSPDQIEQQNAVIQAILSQNKRADAGEAEDRPHDDIHDTRAIVERIRKEQAAKLADVPVEPQRPEKPRRKTPAKKRGDGIRPEPERIVEPDKPSYTMISNAVLDLEGLSATATGIYAFLARHCWDKGECWPGMVRLERRFRMTRTTLRKYLDELILAGALRREHRGRELTNLYTLPYWVHKSSDSQSLAITDPVADPAVTL